MIQRRVEEMGHACHIIEVDALAGSGELTWSADECTIPARGGGSIDARDLDLIWWRRVQLSQKLPNENRVHVELVNNDCRAALIGTLLTSFRGTWVNDPVHALLAENKLLQLNVARVAGFQVPDTLVSQDPERIRRFCAGRPTVLKAVMGTPRAGLLTRMVTDEDLADDAGLRVSPAIYQEYVRGSRHLRVQCFGEEMIAVLITTEELDWRAHLDSHFRVWPLAKDVTARLGEVLRALGLRMGIVDLKVTDEDKIVWLEINQQGQFLFLEGLIGVPLTNAFSHFLLNEAGVSTDVAVR